MKRISSSAFICFLLTLTLLFSSCFFPTEEPVAVPPDAGDEIAFIDHNGGVPQFEIPSKIKAYESYSELDGLGRCGVAEACLGPELMPTEERESISHVTPSGWVQASYPGVVDGNYLYNRCHLIGFQLAGENDNKKNLITGTRFLNIEGMLPFENMVADYIKETGNHVMYRVTPVYKESLDLLPYGVIIEALSLEDGGEGISFSVFSYNKQPGVHIDYSTGKSYLTGETPPAEEPEEENPTYYMVNTETKKFHLPSCHHAGTVDDENREMRDFDRDALISEGFSPCGTCKP